MRKVIVNGEIVEEMQTCKCGRAISWTIYPTEKLVGFYCNACSYTSKLQKYTDYVSQVKAPWNE